MSTYELTAQIEALRSLEELIEEAKAEEETLRDAIKQEMLNRDTEELTAGQYIVRWTSVLSQRFDTRPLLRRLCPMSTRPTPSRSVPAVSPSAYEKSPMHQPASKSA